MRLIVFNDGRMKYEYTLGMLKKLKVGW